MSEKVRQLFQFANDDPTFRARLNLAELGIGTNPNTRRPGNVLEAEKIEAPSTSASAITSTCVTKWQRTCMRTLSNPNLT